MPPRGLSSLEIRVVTRRLASLADAFFDKAYEIARGVLLLRFRAPGEGKREVALGAGSFLVEPSATPETPERPSTFAMVLRKRLGGTKLAAVEQHGFDRVVTFRFAHHGELQASLVAELFGDGNLLLLDAQGRILGLHRHEEWATRTLRPGQTYEYPPRRLDPTAAGPAELLSTVTQAKRKLVAALAVEGGMGGDLAEAVVERSGIDGAEKAAEMTLEEARLVVHALQQILDEAETARGWARLDPEGQVAEVSLIPPRDGEGWQDMDFAAAVTRLHTGPTVERAVREAEDRFAEELRKLETQERVQSEAVARLAVEAEADQRRGELVWLHANVLEKLLAGLAAERERSEWKEIRQAFTGKETETSSGPVRLETIDEHAGILTLLVPAAVGSPDRVPLEIDVRLTVAENANRYYEAAKRAKEKAKGAEAALVTTRQRKGALETRRAGAVERLRAEKARPKAPTRHFWFEPYRWCWTSDGHLLVAGRDAGSNDKVVKRYLDPGDRYVHADVHGAPSCIVKRTEGEPSVPMDALREAGEMAVAYSRAFGQFASADAYWVTPEQVSKTPQAGEYLPKGAFMVRGERNWMRGLPTRAACGIVRLGKDGRPDPDGLHGKVMGGAPSAVSRHAARWVVVEAENRKRSEALREVVAWLECREEEASQALPAAGFRVVEKGAVGSEKSEGTSPVAAGGASGSEARIVGAPAGEGEPAKPRTDRRAADRNGAKRTAKRREEPE